MSVAADRRWAREPHASGYVESVGGLRIFYEVFGEGDPTLLLLPTTPLVHSRQWKAQVPFLSRHFRIVTYDGRGNGRSDWPDPTEVWPDTWHVSDCLAVMAATETERAVLVALCVDGTVPALLLAADQPERVEGIVSISPGLPQLAPGYTWRGWSTFEEERDSYEGWEKENRHYWRQDWRDYLEFFFGQLLPEPHSTKQVEDSVEWALGSSWEINAMDFRPTASTKGEAEALCRRVAARCS